jgi:tetratricopeptide (TPR) repeat protein
MPSPAAPDRASANAFPPDDPADLQHIAANPGDVSVLCRLGTRALDRGDRARAAEWLRRCFEAGPPDADVCLDLGRALLRLGCVGEAVAALQQAVSLRPRFAEAQRALGDAFAARGQLGPAAACYHTALALAPADLDARIALGATQLARRDFTAAENILRAALALQPDRIDALCHLANTVEQLGRHDEAMAIVEQALQADRHSAAAWVMKGCIHSSLNQLEVAVECFQHALAFEPGHCAAGINLANTLTGLGRLEESLAWFSELSARHPASPEVRYNRSFAQLVTGDFAAGWENYEYRSLQGHGSAIPAAPAPLWSGEASLAGRTILLHAEQGLGDTLHFVRYAEVVAAMGAAVHLGVPPPLRGLVATMPAVRSVVTPGEALPRLDFHCPLLSVPRALGTRLETIPRRVPYLFPPAEKIASWRAALGPGPRVGLVWSGNPQHGRDALRSMPLEQFARLTRDVPVRFFAVQKELRPTDVARLRELSHIIPLGERFQDFVDTAAAVACLDLLVTVDTSLAHLAGALAIPTWVLLPFAPDWRWLLQRADSPWYPTLRLFRQATHNDWEPVLAAVHGALQEKFPSGT